MLENFPFSKRVAGDLLADPETSATVLHLILLTAYKDELYGNPSEGIPPMDPVECWLRVKEDFDTQPPETNENKINALMFAISTDAFYDDPLAFTSICSSLYSGDLGDLVEGVMEDLTVSEMLWSIYEVELNRGQSEDFLPAVDSLIAEVIAEEAEDKEDLEVEDVVPFYEKFVVQMRNDMLTQMRTLGVDDNIIAGLLKQDVTPLTP